MKGCFSTNTLPKGHRPWQISTQLFSWTPPPSPHPKSSVGSQICGYPGKKVKLWQNWLKNAVSTSELFQYPISTKLKIKKVTQEVSETSCYFKILWGFPDFPNHGKKQRSHTLTKSLLNHKCYLLAHFRAASERQQVHSLILCHCCPAQWETYYHVQWNSWKSSLHLL